MKDLVLKVFSVFRCTFLGAVYWYFIGNFIIVRVLTENFDLVDKLIIYLFTGLMLGRLASLVLEPLMRKIPFMKIAPYTDYLDAIKNNPRIISLSDTSNFYRDLTSVSFIAFLSHIVNQTLYHNNSIVAVISTIIFGISYVKQNNYVYENIQNCLTKKED